MTTNNYQQLNLKNKNKNKLSKLGKGTESQVWGSFGGLSAGRGKGENWKMVQGSRSIIGRNKTDREMLRTLQEREKPRTYMCDPWT